MLRSPFIFKIPLIKIRITGTDREGVFRRLFGMSASTYYSLALTNTLILTFFIFSVYVLIHLLIPRPIYILEVVILLITSIVFLGGYYIIFPKISQKKFEGVFDKDLMFALNDIALQLDSGITLYNALKNVSTSAYGYASEEFKEIVRELDSGRSVEEALEKAIRRAPTPQYKNVLIQILNTFHSGSRLKNTIKSIVENLKNEQQTKISEYINELNLWSMLYLIVAIVIPAIFTAVLSMFLIIGGGAFNINIILTIILTSIALQIGIIEYVMAKRPEVSF